MKHMKNMAGLLACTALAMPARAFADLNFDATTVSPDAGFEPMPAGWYNAQIDESEMKPTADGTGAYLKVRFHIIDGQYAGRKVYTNLNLKNVGPNGPQTVEIAQKQLSAICHAVGVLKPQKSEELHGRPLKIKLKLRAAQGQYSESNDVVSYKNINDAVDMAGGDAGAAAFGAGAPAAPAGFTAGAAAPVTQPTDAPPSQPWATGAAAPLAGGAAPEAAAQPWSQAPAAASPAAEPAAPPPPPAAPAAPVAEHNPLEAAVKDGWIKHPSAPGYHYKGQEVKTDADVAAMYPAPAPAPEAPAASPPPPAAPAAPAPEAAGGAASDPAATAQAAPPPWAAPKA